MTHPLDGCRVRLFRVDTHLKTLEKVVGASRLEPESGDAPLFKFEPDFERQIFRVRVARDAEIPPMVGVIFGEVVRGLHSVLDNLVYALASLDKPIPESDRDSAFPIVEHANEWFSQDVARKLRYVRPMDRARIETHQPFMLRNGVPANLNILARLARYSNQDKHRTIVPNAAVVMHASLDGIETTDFEITSVEVRAPKLRKNAVVMEGTLSVTGTDPHMDVKGSYTWYPVLSKPDESMAHFAVLTQAYVSDLVEEFGSSSF